MDKVSHSITHHYQPTNNMCGYAALATLLSYYDKEYSLEELVAKVEQPKDAEGTSHGSVTAQLADWCQTEGFQAHMYVSDMFILDLSWQGKSSAEIKQRLEEVKGKRKVSIMDDHWVKVYENAYLSLLEHGADLTVVQFITTELIYKLLKDVSDDLNGKISTHSIVVYGHDEEGNFLISDPWDGMMSMQPEKLILAIAAAQIECDNQIFVIKP